MSSKKDKLLESAQKFIAKGQIDRAIRDYEQIVDLDSADIRHRQKLAELLVRVNRKVEAIEEYEAISKQYSNNHFYLKAIAVYKQIQKLDPDNIKTTLTLASLNQKQGLIGNALAEYNLAVNHYLKAGSLPEAIEVIELMLAADPDNLNTHLKYAETYFAAGLRDKGYGEFTRLALLLRKRGDSAAFSRVCERVKNLYPDKKDFPDGLLKTEIKGGQADHAVDFSPRVAEEALTPEAVITTVPPVTPPPAKPIPLAAKEPSPVKPPPVAAKTPSPAEPPPAVKETPLPAEPPELPVDMSWEEEIELSLLEDEGMDFSRDDAGKEEAPIPTASESSEELLQQKRIDFSELEIDGMQEVAFAETESQPESELEEIQSLDSAYDVGEVLFESDELREIELEIEGPGISPVDLPDLTRTEPAAAGISEKVTEKEKEPAGIPPVKKKRKYDLDGQLNEFKKVLDDQVDKNDTETHYSLGIAYKEMCLFDDAIKEFQTAAQDPQRRIDCMTLEGICYRDKGDFDKAEEIFNNILSMPALTGEEIVSLRYELAILLEAVGRQNDALRLYRQIQSDSPGFRDTLKKIALLHGGDDAADQDEIELLELDVEEFD